MELYLDNQFCQKITDALYKVSFETKEEFICAYNFIDLINSDSIQIKNIPVSKDDFKRLLISNSNFNNLSKIKVELNEINHPFSIVFANSIDTPSTRRDTDVAAYSFEEILKNKDVFFDKKTSDVRADLKSWGKLTNRLLKFQYVIICDNYLFQNNPNNINDFIKSIFLNQNRNRHFEILINTSSRQFVNMDDIEIKEIIDKKFDEIDSMLSQKLQLKNYTFVIMLNNKYHDRHFYTNLQIFESTNSFSLYFNCNAKLHEFSILTKNKGSIILDKYILDLQELKRIYNLRNTTKISNGDFKLFDFI